MNNINQKIAINNAIDRIYGLFKKEYRTLEDGSEIELCELDNLGDDNSGGYCATRDLLYLIDFYNTLDDEGKKNLENKLIKEINYTFDEIKELAYSGNDGGYYTPENSEQWIDSLYESTKIKSINKCIQENNIMNNKYIKAFNEAVSKLDEDIKHLPRESYDWRYNPKTNETEILRVRVIGYVPGDHTKEDFETFMRKYYYNK